jgi:nicotinamide mononucleotide transporter
MTISDWLSSNWIEVFGAITGIIYVFLEIKQNIWLWPVGIITSAVYIIVFFTSKFYADMSLQIYYLLISCAGWYWWMNGTKRRAQGPGTERLSVTRIKPKTGIILVFILVLIYFLLWFILSRLTDSPVPEWDAFITSLSIIATWMLARKIYEHWFLWIAVNSVSSVIFITRGLYPTVVLYMVYLVMSFVGLKSWKRSL